MKTQLHAQAEQVADCIIALIEWRVAVREVNTRPSPEAKHWERECYRALDIFPDAVREQAEILAIRRAA